LRVEGQVRLEFTYQLLSGDIIEEQCRFPLKDHPSDAASREALLFAKIAEATGVESELVTHVIRDFISKGYLEANPNGGFLEWEWTKDKRMPAEVAAGVG
jgi:hypothetical protein